LHHAAASPPSPIEDLQSIPAIPEKVEEWLEELYKNTNQTKEIFIKKIPNVSRKICDFLLSSRNHSINKSPLVSM
jgi:hypothetical protein